MKPPLEAIASTARRLSAVGPFHETLSPLALAQLLEEKVGALEQEAENLRSARREARISRHTKFVREELGDVLKEGLATIYTPKELDLVYKRYVSALAHTKIPSQSAIWHAHSHIPPAYYKPLMKGFKWVPVLSLKIHIFQAARRVQQLAADIPPEKIQLLRHKMSVEKDHPFSLLDEKQRIFDESLTKKELEINVIGSELQQKLKESLPKRDGNFVHSTITPAIAGKIDGIFSRHPRTHRFRDAHTAEMLRKIIFSRQRS